MGIWLDRYRAGECAAVWTEMESVGAELHNPPYRKEAAAVVKETIARAHKNVLALFDELLKLGYQFGGAPETAEPDHPLELRLEHALEYVRQRGGPKHKADPWSHPALAWVEDEEIDVPARFRKGKPGRANFRPPTPRTQALLDGVELPMAVRAWFEKIGSVDLRGSHPVLNREGGVETLRIVLEDACDWRGTAGAEFVSRVRLGCKWGGFPGWAEREDYPGREIQHLRKRLLPL